MVRRTAEVKAQRQLPRGRRTGEVYVVWVVGSALQYYEKKNMLAKHLRADKLLSRNAASLPYRPMESDVENLVDAPHVTRMPSSA